MSDRDREDLDRWPSHEDREDFRKSEVGVNPPTDRDRPPARDGDDD